MSEIGIGSQMMLNIRMGLVWSGWMGGQWAFTQELLPYMEGRILTVLCGGPGDLCINALLTGAACGAINVDASERAVLYGRALVDSMMTQEHMDVRRAANVAGLIERINNNEPGVPRELVSPYLPPKRLHKNVNFHQEDALSYINALRGVKHTPGSTFWYLATPTVLPDGVLSNGRKHFYQLYDDTINIGVNWNDSDSEGQYIKNMIEAISLIDPAARIGFGVGEGDTSIDEYLDMFRPYGKASVVLEKTFRGDGYKFTDWIIMCDLGAAT